VRGQWHRVSAAVDAPEPGVPVLLTGDASVDTRIILDHIGSEELGRWFGEAEATIIGPCRP